MMHEIGGYFGLEFHVGHFPHDDGICLNSACSALRYLIRLEGVSRLYVPRYTCGSVHSAIMKEGCEIVPYDLGDDWFPAEKLPKDAFVLFNNYFGVSGQRVCLMAERHPKLIVDAAQAFYAAPMGLATFYSPRKFFGVPDGGMLCGVKLQPESLPIGTSWDNAIHLLKRSDVDASFGYADFKDSERKIGAAPVLGMSKLTRVLLSNIDYQGAAQRRLRNFAYLQKHLSTTFPLALAEDDVPMVYPYMSDDPRLRLRLIQEKIYVASYWPGIRNCNVPCERILPLPIDQRYDEEGMKRIVEVVKNA